MNIEHRLIEGNLVYVEKQINYLAAKGYFIQNGINMIHNNNVSSGQPDYHYSVLMFRNSVSDGQINDETAMLIMQGMCEESLSPELFEKWEEVKTSLESTRKNLKN